MPFASDLVTQLVFAKQLERARQEDSAWRVYALLEHQAFLKACRERGPKLALEEKIRYSGNFKLLQKADDERVHAAFISILSQFQGSSEGPQKEFLEEWPEAISPAFDELIEHLIADRCGGTLAEAELEQTSFGLLELRRICARLRYAEASKLPSARQFEHPYYWAGFYFAGA